MFVLDVMVLCFLKCSTLKKKKKEIGFVCSRSSSMGPLVGKVKDPQVENIVESLCSNMLAEKEQLRDISSIGLKTVLAEISPTSLLAPAAVAVPLSQTQQSGTGGAPSSGPPVGQPSQLPANVVKRITPRIVSAISKVSVAPKRKFFKKLEKSRQKYCIHSTKFQLFEVLQLFAVKLFSNSKPSYLKSVKQRTTFIFEDGRCSLSSSQNLKVTRLQGCTKTKL